MRTYENTCADCGDTVAAMSEPEPGSSLCYSCATGTPETRLVFVNLDTDTVEDLAHDVFVIDPNATKISDADREILETADHYGAFTDEAREIVRRVGVPFADLWAAYEWRRDMETAGILADVEDYVVQIIPDENPPCPVCHYPLSDHDVAGFPCDGCTESQPMGVWVSSWAGGES